MYISQSVLFKTLNLFPPEKALVSDERARGAYGALPYFLSKVLAELPVAALYPLVFSAVVYPMTGLQPTVRPPPLPSPPLPAAASVTVQRPPQTLPCGALCRLHTLRWWPPSTACGAVPCAIVWTFPSPHLALWLHPHLARHQVMSCCDVAEPLRLLSVCGVR